MKHMEFSTMKAPPTPVPVITSTVERMYELFNGIIWNYVPVNLMSHKIAN